MDSFISDSSVNLYFIFLWKGKGNHLIIGAIFFCIFASRIYRSFSDFLEILLLSVCPLTHRLVLWGRVSRSRTRAKTERKQNDVR